MAHKVPTQHNAGMADIDPATAAHDRQPPGSGVASAAARRRLVRGVFAAPALMTIGTGRAFAQASSLRCLAGGAQPSHPITGSAGYMRVALWQTGPGASKAWVRLVDLQLYGPVSPTTGLGPSTPFLSVNPSTGATESAVSSIPGGASAQNKFVVVKFSVRDNGEVEVTGVGTNPGRAATESCWASFEPTP